MVVRELQNDLAEFEMIAAAACSTLETGHCSWKCIWKKHMILKSSGTSLRVLHSFKDPAQAHTHYLFMIRHQTFCFKYHNGVQLKCCSFHFNLSCLSTPVTAVNCFRRVTDLLT